MNRNKREMYCMLMAVSAPLAHYSGVGYMAVVLAAGAMLPLVLLAGDGMKRITKPEAAVELLWLGLVLGMLMDVSGANWPGNRSEIAVPLALLALAVIGGDSGKRIRACTTLGWVLLILAVPVLVAGLSALEPEWLKPEPGKWSGELIAALLFPAALGIGKRTRAKGILFIGAVAAILAAGIQGVLGAGTAELYDSPLYEAGRCIGNGGFEMIVSAALTLGWYAFASMGMGAAEFFGKKLGLSDRSSRLGAALLAGAVVLTGWQAEQGVLTAGCLALWVLIPMLHPEK